jgi:hypothetical protein
MSVPTAEKTWVPLTPPERRVVGVLIEKQKTTPEYYPMSVAALVSGCNQKSNRDPITNYDADDIDEILQGLRRKGAVIQVEGTGRVVRWKHALYEWLDLKNRPVEMAVVAELLLRGPQTEGELRSRASRMEDIPDLSRLQEVLEFLAGRGLVIYLTPPGQRRGVVVTHGLYPPEELARVREAHRQAAPVEEPRAIRTAPGPAPGPAPAPVWAAEAAALRQEMEALRQTVATLAAEVDALKTALGA